MYRLEKRVKIKKSKSLLKIGSELKTCVTVRTMGNRKMGHS